MSQYDEKRIAGVAWEMPGFQVVKCLSYDNPPKPYFIVREAVTAGGLYIEWGEKYSFVRSAINAVLRTLSWQPGMFTIDDGKSLSGYSQGELWNGWSCPAFERDAIEAWLVFTGNPFTYNQDSDTLTVFFKDSKGNDEADPEEYTGFDIQVDGVPVHVYAVGSGCWVWEQA